MPARKKTDLRPAPRPSLVYSPAEPSAFAEHLVHSECGRVLLSLSCDVGGTGEPRVEARVRVNVRGRDGEDTLEIDIADVDDFVRALVEAIRLARHHRMMPEEASEEMQRRRQAQLDAWHRQHGLPTAPRLA